MILFLFMVFIKFIELFYFRWLYLR